MAGKVRFSFPAGLIENWKVCEVNLDKLMKSVEASGRAIDIENPEGYSGKKINKIKSNFGVNNGMVNMPEINGISGYVHDGLHRLACFKRMGLKVIPVLIPKSQNEEAFRAEFGVDGKYYKDPVPGTYFVVEQGDPYPANVSVFEPIDRKEIMMPARVYKKPVVTEEAITAGGNLDKLMQEGNGRDSGPRRNAPRLEGPAELE